MALTAYWTQFAEDKLEDVFSYYSNKASEKVALRLVDAIITKSLELEKNPLIGQKELLLSDRLQEFRYLVFKNYKIIYFVNREKQRIEVVNLFDCRQNPEKERQEAKKVEEFGRSGQPASLKGLQITRFRPNDEPGQGIGG